MNKNMDKWFHAIHMLRTFQFGHFYHPPGWLSLLEMTQKNIELRNRKLFEGDME